MNILHGKIYIIHLGVSDRVDKRDLVYKRLMIFAGNPIFFVIFRVRYEREFLDA